MGEDTENHAGESDWVKEVEHPKADDLARIIIAYGDKITQLTVNHKAVTPLMTIKLHSLIVDCVAEIMETLGG